MHLMKFIFQRLSMMVMVPTADTKISRNIEEEAMASKAKAETVIEASAVAEAAITVRPEGLSTACDPILWFHLLT